MSAIKSLQFWRNEDQEDSIVLTRHEVINLLDEVFGKSIEYKRQPSIYDIDQIGGLPELNNDVKYGIAIAAWIVRSYGKGEVWAEVIECYGEQRRAQYWLKKESI